MAITREDIDRLADLARMKMDDEEKTRMLKDIEAILGYVSQVTDIEGDARMKDAPLRNVLRDDVVRHEPGEFTDALLANAPSSKDGYVAVKNIL